MKKTISIILALFCLVTIGEAQMRSNTKSNVAAIGIKGGLNVPSMLYTDGHLSTLDQDFGFKPVEGVFVDIPLGESFSLAPEAMYVHRGMSTSYEHHSGASVNYSISSSYVDLRLPFAYRLHVVDAFQPYAVAGVEAGYLLGGEIHLDRSNPIALDTTINIGSANMAQIHAGVFAGVGIRSDIDFGVFALVLKLEATYHQGVLDSFSKKEHDESSTPVNVNAYNITGVRLPRGIEFCVSVGVPLKFNTQKDACWTFSRNKYN